MIPARHQALVFPALGLASLLLLWETLSRNGVMAAVLIPPPSAILPVLINEIESGIWLEKVLASLRHYCYGLLLGSLLGVTLGTTVALLPRLELALAWIVRVLRPIPPLAWIPFAIIWFGVSEAAAVFIISIGVFWINFYTAASAVQAVDREYIELARAFGRGGPLALLWRIVLPAASPGILAGLRAGIGQGWMTVVAAELFGIPGIGQRMIEASGLLATDVVILYMFTISALYGLTDALFVWFRDRLLAWQK